MKLHLTDCVSWQEFDGTVYVFNEHTKKVYLFSDTARDFWMAVVEYGAFDACLAALCRVSSLADTACTGQKGNRCD